MLIPLYQNVGQNHNIKIANRLFENVITFTYLGMTVVILYYHWKHKLPYCPGYIASGRTVEKTVLLALVV
jgi:hypothetical protein